MLLSSSFFLYKVCFLIQTQNKTPANFLVFSSSNVTRENAESLNSYFYTVFWKCYTVFWVVLNASNSYCFSPLCNSYGQSLKSINLPIHMYFGVHGVYCNIKLDKLSVKMSRYFNKKEISIFFSEWN